MSAAASVILVHSVERPCEGPPTRTTTSATATPPRRDDPSSRAGESLERTLFYREAGHRSHAKVSDRTAPLRTGGSADMQHPMHAP